MKKIFKLPRLLISFILTISLMSCNSAPPASNPPPNTTPTPSIATAIEKQPEKVSPVTTAAPIPPEVDIKKETPKTEEQKPPLKLQGLVNILDIDSTIVVDLKYSTTDNFTGKVIYNFKTCLLREETALKLSKANKALAKSGYRIKIYDGYRPPSAQQILWKTVPNSKYVANPSKGGSIHSKGAAVDITLVDINGKELEMPTKFDDFTAKASPNSREMSENARKNLHLLTEAMTSNSFNIITSEWWHFNDTDSSNYSSIEVDPRKFEGSQN